MQNTTLQGNKERTDGDYNDRNFNRTKFPEFQRTSERKNMFLIGSSTLKRMSPRKMSTEKITTKVKTIRGGRIRDIEECLINYISDRKLDNVDVIAVHVGTNNVSDRDSVYAIINDYRNLIHTVKQSLPRTELLISSILPRPTDYQANVVIAEVNRQLFTLEEKQVKILDNTLDFLYGNRPNQSLFQDHVHTNTAGAKVLSDNKLSSVYNMFGRSDRMSHYEQNFNRRG